MEATILAAPISAEVESEAIADAIRCLAAKNPDTCQGFLFSYVR
jgi:hypothetical protein